MSGRHPWNKLFEKTFTPEQRARIIRDADKLVADNPVETLPRTRRAGPHRAAPQEPQPTGTTTSTR